MGWRLPNTIDQIAKKAIDALSLETFGPMIFAAQNTTEGMVGSLEKEGPICRASLGFDIAHRAKSGCYASSDCPTILSYGRRLARRKIPELWCAIAENSHPPLFIVNGLCVF